MPVFWEYPCKPMITHSCWVLFIVQGVWLQIHEFNKTLYLYQKLHYLLHLYQIWKL